MIPPNLFLFPQIFLAIKVLLPFHKILESSPSKNSAGNLIAIKSIDLGRVDIFATLTVLIHEHDMSLHLFTYFLFILFLWLRWAFIAARGLSLVATSRGYALLPCAGFSLQWLLLLQSMGSRRAGFSSCGSRALECRLSSCGAQA